MWGVIAAAAVGATLSAYSRSKELSALRDQKRFLRKQKEIISDQADESRKMLKLEAEDVAANASAQSQLSAMAAFQNKSAGDAQASQSGIASGSPFYKTAIDYGNAVDMMKSQDMAALRNQKRIVSESNSIDLQEKGQLLGINAQMSAINKQLDYGDSPLSWVLSLGSGAMNGVSMAASAKSDYTELTSRKPAVEQSVSPSSSILSKPSLPVNDYTGMRSLRNGSFDSTILYGEDFININAG